MITVKCLVCGKEFEAQRKSAKFCSANCRVKFNNKLGDLSDKITTADKIPEPPKPMDFDLSGTYGTLEQVNKMIKQSEYKIAKGWKDFWEHEIERYCVENDITPADLIETHLQSLKMARKGQKNEKMPIKEAKEEISNWRSDYIKKKTGIGLLPEKIKDPYKNQ